MTQIEKIRAMSAEELASYLYTFDLFTFCFERHCPLSDGYCTKERCIAAGVRYLESEVEEK